MKLNDLFTRREKEILVGLCKGLTNREIADRLNLSIKTIEVHKARALEKLGLRTRAELVQYVLRSGWLPLAENREFRLLDVTRG